MSDVFFQEIHQIGLTKQTNFEIFMLARQFFCVMHGCQSMVQSASKSPKTEYFIPATRNCLFDCFFEIVGILVPNLLKLNMPSFIVFPNMGLQTIKITNNSSDFGTLSKRRFIKSIGSSIGQHDILATIQCFSKPLQIEFVVHNDHTFNTVLSSILKQLKIASLFGIRMRDH